MSGFLVDLLAVGAHPDDVELFCGGTVIRAADLGHGTGILDLTRGERASHGTPEERAREAEAAAGVLGVRFRENLGLPDTALDPASREQLCAVVAALRRLRPEILLIPWVEERHPDHEAAGELLRRAVFYAGVAAFDAGPGPRERFVPRQVLHYALRYPFVPSFVVDTSAAATRKAEAIACHASQVTRRPGEAPTLISARDAVAALEARDRYYGSMIGASHGEPLRCVATPGLVDVVRHFRDNPFEGAHAFLPRR
ncbi:MAG: bacillithiol biosynthesis deacetylase BshB1 [Acidobacteria bacterium]|nr:bacillithiol biosynthesis deacetylase BshB1 [Acidobacteriota bacterium]